MQNIEALASSLDAQVLEYVTLSVFGQVSRLASSPPLCDSVMQSLQFSDSPLLWNAELSWIFPEIYRFVARSTKKDIRAVARLFRRTSRIDRLSDYIGEFDIRAETMNLILSAVRAISVQPAISY